MPATLRNATDQFAFSVYHRPAIGVRLGGIVILQEIFGIDRFMLADAARWAAAGYEVIVPSIFDRIERGYKADHDSDGIAGGFRAMSETPNAQALGDISACVAHLEAAGPVFIIGYCYGGRLAWQAAGAIDGIAAAAVYYGNILPFIDQRLRCPVICFFGARDGHLPVAEIAAKLASNHSDVPTTVYSNSGHGFNNEATPDADPEDAIDARQRSLAFFATHG